jgi:RND family efflux transporter MFP subunit
VSRPPTSPPVSPSAVASPPRGPAHPHWATDAWRARYGPWAVVTGASSGIGRAVARELAAAGLDLVLVARRADALDALALDLAHAFGATTRVIAADLAAAGAAAQVDAETRDLDVGLLVAAAGYGTSGPFLAADLDDERAMLRVNAEAVAELSLAFGRRLAARRRGGLILFGSVVGFQGAPLSAHYAATKAYVQSLAEALHVEWAPIGLDVLASAPGPTHTGFAARAGLRMGAALDAATVARATLAALGRRSTVRPGALSKALAYALGTLPRAARVRVMGRVMHGMTAHREAAAPGAPRVARAAGAVLVAAALGSAAACGPNPDARADDGGRAAGAPAEAPAVPVRVAPAAQVARPDSVRAGGVVEARATSELAFQVGGRLVAVPVDEGTRVARGALLAAVDPTDSRLALRQAELQRDRADDELRRAEVLRAAGSIAPVEYDRLLTGARQARVARDLAAKRLADTRLTAPFGGVVARKGTEVGATAAAGSAVFTLVDLDVVRVRAAVPEADVGRLRAGQPAEVTLEALADSAPARGRVTAVGVTADPASRTYSVQIEVPNASHRLRAGMVASAAVATGTERDAVAVPAGAVARDADGATLVYVFDRAAGRARARRVTVGAPVDGGAPGLVRVARGLDAGEPVVVAGQQRVRDGARVSVVGADGGPRPAGAEP